MVPVYETVGRDGFVAEEPARYVAVPESMAVQGGVFWVVGDDSFGTYTTGDLILVDPAAAPAFGDLVVVSLDGGAGELWRYAKRDGEILLVADNPRVTPHRGDYRLLGVGVALMRALRRGVKL